MQRIFKSITSVRELSTTHITLRNYYLSKVNFKPQSNLALLRKKTGLPIIKCKEALTKFTDLGEAESWLEEEARREGMQRVSLDRATANGVIALNVVRGESVQRTALIELNCETDHLSLSSDFRRLAANVCQLIAGYNQLIGNLSVESMLAVPQDGGLTVLDAITGFVGRAKENTNLKRGIVQEMRGDKYTGSYVHNALDLSNEDSILKVGTHGSFVELEKMEGVEGEEVDAHSLADQLAQHVVGMPQEGSEEKMETLLAQPWLFDLDRTVSSVLESNQLRCVQFVRYEIGK